MSKGSYNPEDEFKEEGRTLGLTVLDFWKYAYSDLNADPRDMIAEFLVSNALGICESINRQDWTLYDILYKGVRIEVKCTGYYQTWREDDKISLDRRFSIKKAIDRNTKVCERHNDIYVFCLLNGQKREAANPLLLENWDFYVIPTYVINRVCQDNQTIRLNTIKKMGYASVAYRDLKNNIVNIARYIYLKNTLNTLSVSQIQFICKECNVSEDVLAEMDGTQIYDTVYETMRDIEMEDGCRRGNAGVSHRRRMALDIVTELEKVLTDIDFYGEEHNLILENLRTALTNVQDSYDDFVQGVMSAAQSDDKSIEKIIRFIEDDKTRTSSDIIEYLDRLGI